METQGSYAASLADETRRDVFAHSTLVHLRYFATIHIFTCEWLEWNEVKRRKGNEEKKIGMRQCLLIAVCVRDYHMYACEMCQAAAAVCADATVCAGCEIIYYYFHKSRSGMHHISTESFLILGCAWAHSHTKPSQNENNCGSCRRRRWWFLIAIERCMRLYRCPL